MTSLRTLAKRSTEPVPIAWVGVVAFGAIFGIGELARWWMLDAAGHGWLGFDANLVLDAAGRLARGVDPYADPIFLWAPPSALAVMALQVLPAGILVAGWALVKISIAGVGALWASRARSVPIQSFVLFGVLTSLPVLHDVALGNVMVPMAATIALVAWRSDRWSTGVPLGILAAAVPKPFLVPLLVWMAVHRPRATAGAIIAAAAVTVITGLAVGPSIYGDWLRNLAEFGSLAAAFPGNAGLSASAPALVIPVSILALAGLGTLLVHRSDPDLSLLYALAAGVVAAPYASQLSIVPLLVVLPAAVVRLPRATLIFVALMPLAAEWGLPIWAIGLASAAFWAGLRTRLTAPQPPAAAAADPRPAVAVGLPGRSTRPEANQS